MRACAPILTILIATSFIIGFAVSSRYATRALAQTARETANSTDVMARDVVTLDSKINGLQNKLSELESKSSTLSERIKSIGAQIMLCREKLANQRVALSARARRLYINGPTNKLAMLVSSDDVSDFFKRKEMLQKVAERDAQLIRNFKTEADALSASMSEMEQRKKEINKISMDLRSRARRLENDRSARAAILTKAGERSGDVTSRSNKIEEKIKEINPQVPTGKPTGRIMMMVATAYSPEEPGLSNHTASGMLATRGVVAVDPRVIPLGTRLNVEGYGNCIAGDTGSTIKGNRIDLCFDTLAEMNAFGGYRTVRVEILE